MAGGQDLAPWETGSEERRPADDSQPTAKQYRPPRESDLPEIYKAETRVFIAPRGKPVPRPPVSPRTLEPRGKTALLVTGGAALVGVVLMLLALVVVDSAAGAIQHIYISAGALVSLAALLILAMEMGRIKLYREADFHPGMLLFGSINQMLKVAGPAGLAALTANTGKVTGVSSGILARIFDRSASAATAPEAVALLVNRGSGPELISIEWDAVRLMSRGDILWYHPISNAKYVMFHALIPYAPPIVIDSATKREIYKTLRVGESLYKELPQSALTGTRKVLKTDRSGNIVLAGAKPEPAPMPSVDMEDNGMPTSPMDSFGQDLETDVPEPPPDGPRIGQ